VKLDANKKKLFSRENNLKAKVSFKAFLRHDWAALPNNRV